MRVQASLLASAALTAEVDVLKQNLERSEQDLGRAKKQLEKVSFNDGHMLSLPTSALRFVSTLRLAKFLNY